MSTPISGLPAASTVQISDLVPIVQNGVTLKTTAQLLVNSQLPTASTVQAGIIQIGTTAGTACDGADARLSNARTPSGSAGGDLAGSYPTPVLAASGVVAGTFGSSDTIPVVIVDVKGRITSATQAIVSISSAQITGISAAQVGSGITSAQLSAITGTGAVVLASSPTIATSTINGYTEGTVAVGTVGATATLAITAGTVLTATLTASTACTFTMPPVGAGKSFVLYLKQAAVTGNGTATFTAVAWPGAVAPVITATAGRMDILSCVYDGVKGYGNFAQNFTY